MSAVIISMQDYQRDHATERALRQSLEQVRATNEGKAHAMVLERLRGKVTGSILAQAQARAARLVSAGTKMADAVNRACAWAMYAVHPDGPEAA